MGYYQEIVAEFLQYDRHRFVSQEFLINTGGPKDPPTKGNSWYVDIVAVDFLEKTIFLCEVTYSKKLTAVRKKLTAWGLSWPAVCKELFLLTNVPKEEWKVVPWIFAPNDRKAYFDQWLKENPQHPFPDLKWKNLEDTAPWKRKELSQVAAEMRKKLKAAEHEAEAA